MRLVDEMEPRVFRPADAGWPRGLKTPGSIGRLAQGTQR